MGEVVQLRPEEYVEQFLLFDPYLYREDIRLIGAPAVSELIEMVEPIEQAHACFTDDCIACEGVIKLFPDAPLTAA